MIKVKKKKERKKERCTPQLGNMQYAFLTTFEQLPSHFSPRAQQEQMPLTECDIMTCTLRQKNGQQKYVPQE